MNEQSLNDQQEPIYNEYVPIQDVSVEGWKIEKGGERVRETCAGGVT